MPQSFVLQLRFTRQEFQRCLTGISTNEAVKRLEPMNCLSWIIGHLADQENYFWVKLAQNKSLHPELRDLVGYGKPASTPQLNEMWSAWENITTFADKYLDSINEDTISEFFEWNDKKAEESIGTLLLRNIYHYWYHIGEAHAIRQQLGHTKLPQFVGNIPEGAFAQTDNEILRSAAHDNN